MNVLVAFDGSAESVAALDWAARLEVSAATVLCVQPPSAGGEERGYRGRRRFQKTPYASPADLREAVDRLTAGGISATSLEKDGSPARTIVETAGSGGYDLVVIGVRKRNPVMRFLFGSTAETVARQASTPVLLVRVPAAGGKEP